VFSGDFYQLPTVNETEFCFESSLWNKLFEKNCQIDFHTIFRQKETEFQRILNQIRKGTIDKKDVSVLRKYMNHETQKDKEPTKLLQIRYKVVHICFAISCQKKN